MTGQKPEHSYIKKCRKYLTYIIPVWCSWYQGGAVMGEEKRRCTLATLTTTTRESFLALTPADWAAWSPCPSATSTSKDHYHSVPTQEKVVAYLPPQSLSFPPRRSPKEPLLTFPLTKESQVICFQLHKESLPLCFLKEGATTAILLRRHHHDILPRRCYHSMPHTQKKLLLFCSFPLRKESPILDFSGEGAIVFCPTPEGAGCTPHTPRRRSCFNSPPKEPQTFCSPQRRHQQTQTP